MTQENQIKAKIRQEWEELVRKEIDLAFSQTPSLQHMSPDDRAAAEHQLRIAVLLGALLLRNFVREAMTFYGRANAAIVAAALDVTLDDMVKQRIAEHHTRTARPN